MMHRILVLGLILITLCQGAHALETDQYQIWKGPELKEASQPVNKKLNELFQEYLDRRVNGRMDKPLVKYRPHRLESKYTNYRRVIQKNQQPLPSQKVAKKFLAYIRPHFFKNRLKEWMIKEPTVEMFPAQKHLFRDYQKSIFRGFVWPFVMPVSQTVKINDVYLGTDKIDHFFSSGRRYYGVYLRALKKGLSHEEALKKAIHFGLGFLEEKGVLGFWSSGAFSYADLESNYQGMILAIDLCCHPDPMIRLNSNGQWEMIRKIDVKKYVNPLWDEAYNNSYYAFYRRRKIKKVFQQEYCELGQTPKAIKLWKKYVKNSKPSVNTNYLKEQIHQNKIPNPKRHSLATFCGYPPGVMDGVPFWDQ